jgi:predicted ATPase
VVVESVREEAASYRRLKPLRQYASSQLDPSGEVADVRRRHAVWHVERAERASPELSGPNAVTWLQKLDPRLPNLRASMKWLLDQSDTAEFARLREAS